jgi:alkylation response protein AidB-like acyl-CoA dehydrogenase
MPETILYDRAMPFFGDLVTQEVPAVAEQAPGRLGCGREHRHAVAANRPSAAPAIAAAKIRAGEAAEIARQVHGAIGFAHEHGLHRLTRRLWSWRD